MSANDTSLDRSFQQLPDFVSGYNSGTNAPVSVPTFTGGGYPGFQVVVVPAGVDQLSLSPIPGAIVIIDARLATADVVVRSAAVGAPVTAATVRVLAGSYGPVISDGGGWKTTSGINGFVPTLVASATFQYAGGVLTISNVSPAGSISGGVHNGAGDISFTTPSIPKANSLVTLSSTTNAGFPPFMTLKHTSATVKQLLVYDQSDTPQDPNDVQVGIWRTS